MGLHEVVCLHRDADKPRPSSWDQDVVAAEVERMNPNLSPQTKIGCRARPVHMSSTRIWAVHDSSATWRIRQPPGVATSHRKPKLLKERHPDYHCRNLDRSKLHKVAEAGLLNRRGRRKFWRHQVAARRPGRTIPNVDEKRSTGELQDARSFPASFESAPQNGGSASTRPSSSAVAHVSSAFARSSLASVRRRSEKSTALRNSARSSSIWHSSS